MEKFNPEITLHVEVIRLYIHDHAWRSW